MALYICQACGGQVVKKKDNFYVCLYCGTLQTFDGSQVGNDPHKSSAAAKRDIAAEYRTACKKMSAAKTSADYKAAAEMFGKISDYQNAAELMAECHQKAKALQIEERYTSACNMMKEQNIHFMQQAAAIFQSMPDYRDSSSKYTECLSFIRSQQEILDRKNRELEEERAKEKKKKRIIAIVIVLAFILINILISKH